MGIIRIRQNYGIAREQLFEDEIKFRCQQFHNELIIKLCIFNRKKKQKRRPLSLCRNGGERPAYEIERTFPNLTESGRTLGLLVKKMPEFIFFSSSK
jgi:hypothetical protein